MGTILHEGEYILISHKITNETGYVGYTLLTHIGINTSKVNFLGSTRHFCTYAVIKDLELPFSTSEWQDFEVKNVRFHAYTMNLKNLILLEHDEDSFDYLDEMNEFFERKEREKKEMEEDNKMTIEANKYIYIASNTIGSSDDQLISALLGYVPTCTKYETIHGCALLWSRTKFIHERYFDVTDAKRRLHEMDEKLDIVRTSYGDTIIYRDVNDEVLRILDAYYEYRKKDEPYVVDSKKYVYDRNRRLNVDSHVSFNCQPILTMPRNLGRSAAMSMLNSFYDRDNNDTEKEKKNMLNNKFIVNEDYFMTGAGLLTSNPYFDIKQSVPDNLPDITLEDLRIESSVRTEPLIRGTFMVGPGVVRQPSKFQFTQYAGYKYLFEGGYINSKKPPLKFKLIFGQEHATGRYKTICLWEDGEKTIICGDNKVTKLPVAQAFAWCYVKRTFRSVSQFKKHVDKRTTKMDGVWYFEGDCLIDEYAQGSVPGTSKKRDIYDAAALAIVTKRYGGLRKLVDEYINKEDK